MTDLLRGRVYRIDLGADIGLKPFLVVSRDATIVVWVTCSRFGSRRRTRSTCPLSSPCATSMHRWLAGALCDRITVIYPDEIQADLGAVSAQTMRAVEEGLLHALGILR